VPFRLNPQGRDPLQRIPAIWEALLTLSGDPALALHLGERSRPRLHIVNCLAMCSPTLRVALSRMVRFWGLACFCSRAGMEVERRSVRLTLELGDPRAHPHYTVEFRMAAWIALIRWMTGEEVRPLRVEFRFPPPGYSAEHERIFRAPVRFGQPRNALVFAEETMGLPLLDGDPVLAGGIARLAEEQLAQGGERRSVRGQLAEVLRTTLPQGESGIKAAAPRLNMSVRTLQRRLRAENTSFKEVLNRQRMVLCLEYMNNPAISFGEMAYLLGFSNAANFHRSFRLAAGTTPARYRDSLHAAAPAPTRAE
jgi:AraC-like DNA-binding protein